MFGFGTAGGIVTDGTTTGIPGIETAAPGIATVGGAGSLGVSIVGIFMDG